MNLKYKIWDKINKLWVQPPYCINQFGDLQVKDIVLNNMDDFEVCISLNIKDMYKNEIYEGDIINFRKCFHIDLRQDRKIIVKFNQKRNCLDVFELNGADILWLVLQDVIYHSETRVEIIGNIYDNPELLK